MKRACLVCGFLVLAAGSLLAQTGSVPAKLSIDDALSIAGARNQGLAMAREAAARADASLTGASLRPNPSITASTNGFAFSRDAGSSWIDNQELTFRVEQELEIGGRRARRVESASLGIEAAKAELRDRWRQLELDVRRAYFAVVLAKADDDVSALTLADIDQLVAVSKVRLEQGEISGVEMRRLQVERFRFADERFAAQLALKHARSGLLALLGSTTLDQVFETIDALSTGSTLDVVPPLTAAVVTQAFEARPDLQAIRRQRDRALADVRLQRALKTPPITLGAGYRRDFGAGGLVLDVKVPIGLFDRNQGGMAIADADARAAQAMVAAAEIAVTLDLQRARDSLEVSTARAAYVEREYLRNAREARDIILASYRAGAATLTDYLDAQRALREAQRVANRAQFDCRISRFQFDAALGRSTPLPEDRRERIVR
jgi:cobalt-zinc-cadmium efflux system outer membrane protein